MNIEDIPAHELLPHGPEMTLIDRLLSSDSEQTVAVVDIRASSHLAGDDGVPSYVGIEYMAQTIAARVGYESRCEGREPPIGFLLGTRSFHCSRTAFEPGCRLEVCVRPLFVDGGFGAFDCEIRADEILARAVLNTYQPGPELLARITRGDG